MKKDISLFFYWNVMMIVSMVLVISCAKESDKALQLPVVTTSLITNITQNTATGGGNVLVGGGDSILVKGICWDTLTNPALTASHTSDGAGAGFFVSNLTGLNPNTSYYVRAYATNSTGTSYGAQVYFVSTTMHYLGENYGGGIVFYLDSTGQHGLISAPANQSKGAEWGCNGTTIGDTSVAIGKGQFNTLAILTGCSAAGIAARICNDLVLNSYDDWFLPSRDELNQMYVHKNIIGGFADNYYWSSTEVGVYHAWAKSFWSGGGYTNPHVKYAVYYVRAIRAF
jgi:hypothetical protein